MSAEKLHSLHLFVRALIMRFDTPENAEFVPSSEVAVRLNQGNQDLQYSRHQFVWERSSVSAPPRYLDFGDWRAVYGTNPLNTADQTLLAQTAGRHSGAAVNGEPGLVSGNDIARHAHELGEKHPSMWATERGPHGEIRKCNLFADKACRDLDLPLPWEKGHTPTVHHMKQQLMHSPDWKPVYQTGQPFDSYKPRPGDLAIWDKTISSPYHRTDGTVVMQRTPIEHCGIIGTDGEIVYAGSARGYAESDFELMSHAVAWGPPSVIFRSLHVK
jgi:hypothetical protein